MQLTVIQGRSPQGERGLKQFLWRAEVQAAGRSPQGERGLKLPRPERRPLAYGRRSPQGERGLKLALLGRHGVVRVVAPRKGSVG